MTNYLLKLLVLIAFSFVIIFFYYLPGLGHIENFDGYASYVIVMGTIYTVYKYFQVQFSQKKVEFSLVKILSYFLLHLFILSTLFFSYNNLPLSSGIMLFFKIIFFSLLPIIIISISIAFGKKIINLLGIDKDTYSFHIEEDKNGIFTFLLSLGVGFFSFVTLSFILGLIGFYNIWTVSIILIGFLVFSLKELKEILSGFLSYKITYKSHNSGNNFIEKLNLKLLFTEFLFIVATLIISVNLISIVRPMPIGWDDLGVYMNFPRQLAYAGEIFALGGMYSWQVFTGIGYMVGEPTQAFFLNNVGGILSFIVIILVLTDLVKGRKKTFLNIPLLLATAFISMPMLIFQQAKDMKLDSGLFFISVIALYILYKTFFTDLFTKKENLALFKQKQGKEDKKKLKLILKVLFLIGIISGFAFSIKFTSLMLISAIIGALFYIKIGGFGFLGYLGIFISIFTKFGLWSYLNVSYPKENLNLINSFSALSFIMGAILIFIGIKRYGFLEFKKLLVRLSVFLLGVFIAISPWLAKNIYEAKDDLSLGRILNGKVETFRIDYSKIYDEKELSLIEKKQGLGLNSSGTTTNEDFGRYLGYEKGINNYIKLPWNLTMQLNQGGEFTTIGFLFLALLPALFLFLPYRKKYFSLGILGFLLLELMIFVISGTKSFFTDLMSKILLPEGYLVLFGLLIIGVSYLLLTLRNTRLMILFKINLVFTAFYTFLWAISAFGIVWYGIMMYFGFLMMIAISIYCLVGYKKEDNKKLRTFKFFGALLTFLIFLVWFFASVFPHSFNNLKNAGYPYYKQSKFSASELVFGYHSDYLKMIYNLNIDKNKRQDFILNSIKNNDIKKMITPYLGDIYKINDFLKAMETGFFDNDFKKLGKKNLEINKLKSSAKQAKISIYNGILHPYDEYKNKDIIYRMGTFLKYFIVDNHKRVYTDSLITEFDKYVYDKDTDKIISRMKKLGFSYFLVDLNAATIDKDPRHDLTRRYENVLKTFTSDKLELIEADSICLKFALERYKKSDKTAKDLEKYMITAGVNYESYTKDGKVIKRQEKMLSCYKDIVDVINNGKVDDKNYSYLLNIKNILAKKSASLKNGNDVIREISRLAPHGARVLFEIK